MVVAVIFCNGHPKSGTHMLMKVCALLGLKSADVGVDTFTREPELHVVKRTGQEKASVEIDFPRNLGDGWFCHAHIPRPEGIEREHKVITVFRDPRNVMISQSGGKLRPNQIGQYVKSCGWYLSWLDTAGLCVRFENLVTEKGVGEIADWLGVGLPKGAHEHVWGGRILPDGSWAFKGICTFSGKWKDWREVWTPKYQEIWEQNRGPDFMAILDERVPIY